MRWVQLDEVIDPTAYLEQLPALEAVLPPGAWTFASDPDHYDFAGVRCVKDLEVEAIDAGDDGAVSLAVRFAANPWKHEAGLTVRYGEVVELAVVAGDVPLGRKRLGSVILDEVQPHEHGCRHEIALHGGTIVVVAADLVATWDHPGPDGVDRS